MTLSLNASFIRAAFLPFLIFLLISCSNSTTTIEEPPELFFTGIQSSFVGDEFNFKIESEDPQGVNVEIIVEGLPDWLTYLPSEAALTGIPNADDTGSTRLR